MLTEEGEGPQEAADEAHRDAQVLCEVEGLDVVDEKPKDVTQVGQHKKRMRAVVSSDEDESEPEPEGDEEVIS